jgi:TolA-binding protein
MLTNFEKAATTFRHITDRFPEASYVEEAMFLIGENYYNQRDFPAAAEAYRELLDNYPRGRYSDSALYSLAWCQFEQEDMAGGVARMAVLVKDYPDSDFAAKAQFTVGDFHYNNREYDQALVAYRSLIENYAGTAEAGRAQALVDELSEIEASMEYSKVMARFEEKDYEKAITGFQSIIKNYPGTYTQLAAYCNLGLTYEILRKWPEAVENYDKTLSNGDDDIENSDVVNFARIHRDWIVENRL